MGFMDSRLIYLDDGTTIRLRNPGMIDARRILAYRKSEARTHDFEVVTAEEIKDDEELQRKWLFSYIQEPNKLCLIAETVDPNNAEVVGMLDFYGHPWQRLAHHGTMGIGVAASWRGRGIGRALIQTMLEWASMHPSVEKVYLGVWANNLRAQALYASFGFTEESRREAYFKLGHGHYIDEIVMSLWVKDPNRHAYLTP
ncbi:MAG: GNAT family N-acetyltransferase [Myxococcales bacterium]|nr:GNAT family N-acetyltransferase [Myxococcales bacterium]